MNKSAFVRYFSDLFTIILERSDAPAAEDDDNNIRNDVEAALVQCLVISTLLFSINGSHPQPQQQQQQVQQSIIYASAASAAAPPSSSSSLSSSFTITINSNNNNNNTQNNHTVNRSDRDSHISSSHCAFGKVQCAPPTPPPSSIEDLARVCVFV